MRSFNGTEIQLLNAFWFEVLCQKTTILSRHSSYGSANTFFLQKKRAFHRRIQWISWQQFLNSSNQFLVNLWFSSRANSLFVRFFSSKLRSFIFEYTRILISSSQATWGKLAEICWISVSKLKFPTRANTPTASDSGSVWQPQCGSD